MIILMNTYVVLFSLLSVFALNTTSVLAYNPQINNTVIPYEIFPLDNNIETQTEYLGELTGDPQMYEFTISATTTLKLRLSQLETETPIPFSLITVRKNDKNDGVSEVGRLLAKDNIQEVVADNVLGLTFLTSQIYEAEIGTGIYRVEVSTPDNFGSYILTVGDVPEEVGYFKTVSDVWTIQSFFKKPIFSLLKSSYVHYPFGIIILLGLLFITWRKRNFIKNKHA